MRILRLLISSSKRLFFVATITSVLTGLFSTLVIKTIHEAIQDDTSFDQQAFIFKFLLFWGLYGLLSVVSSYTISLITIKIIHTLRIRLSAGILRARFETMEHHQQRMLPILTEDVKTIAFAIDRLPSVTTGMATVLGILGYMIWYSYQLTLATIGIFFMVFLFTKVTLPYVRKYAGQARDHLNALFEQFHGLVFGIKELALNQASQRKYLDDLIKPTSSQQNKSYLKESIVTAVINRSTDMILLFGMAVLIVVVFQTGFVTLDYFGEYLTLVLFTLAPLSTATGFFSGLKRMDVALQQVEEVELNLGKSTREHQGVDQLVKGEDGAAIQLKQLEHSYYHSDQDEHFALGPLDLSIHEGETIFIVGGNGSGKTTLAKLILGLYQPLGGTIGYYGQEVSEKNIFSYRSHFSAVFTDSYLFKTFLDVDPAYLEKQGDKLLKMFELTKKVKIENHGFSTKNLSEGQKKRLTLIASILEDKDIYLFDEWAANQDPVFKKTFYEEIIPFLKVSGKTLIIISHDDQYFHLADRLIKLRDGKLTEMNA